MPDITQAIVVRLTAGCERCGLWHEITLRRMSRSDELPKDVHPICWVCGLRPLVSIGPVGNGD